MSMTDQHKTAMAEGREHARHVKAYLAGLKEHRPKRGRQVTAEVLSERLRDVEAALLSGSYAPLQRLQLVQERMDLRARIEAADEQSNGAGMAELEAGFVAHAAAYASQKGISRAAFRQLGVSAAVLTKAGVR